MNLELGLNGIKDGETKENFQKLEEFVDEQNLLEARFKFFEVEFDSAVTNFKLKHDLGYVPKDVIISSTKGTGEVVLNYDKFDKDYIDISTNGAVKVRMFAGSYGHDLADSKSDDSNFGGHAAFPANTKYVPNTTISLSIVPTNDLVVSLKTEAGNDPSVNDPILARFQDRSDGTIDNLSITSPLSTTIQDGSLLGIPATTSTNTIYLYLVNDAGTVSMAYSTHEYSDHSVQEVIGDTTGTADLSGLLYGDATIASPDPVIIQLGKMVVSRTAGSWSLPATEIQLMRRGMNSIYHEVDCILKAAAGSYDVLNSGAHFTRGVEKVETPSSTVCRLHFPFTATQVLSFVVGCDSATAAEGVFAGGSIGTNSADISVYRVPRLISGRVSYNGSSWDVDDAEGNLVVTSFTSNQLTLTHDTCTGQSISIVSASATLIPYMVSETSTTTVISFNDYSGTIQTSASTAMDIVFTRAEKADGKPYQLTATEFGNISSANLCVKGSFEV